MAGVCRVGDRCLAGRIFIAWPAQCGLLGVSFSSVLWTVWGLHTQAMALVALQACLAAMNIRGLFKTDKEESNDAG